MSESNDAGAANGSSAQFTERELQMLGWAMHSLKTGPPEIDYEKLASFAGMSNPRSASNAWAKIKNKLMTPAPDGTVPATPKKAGGRKKAAATPKADDSEVGEAAATPKKTPKKRVAKKQDVDGADDASSKKKGRATKEKESDDEANVKAGSDNSKDLEPGGADVEAEVAEDSLMAEV
ncbi:hypothetical protein EK21DRAFT_112358 [Setomelanomma holmii]|uniref:Uncharacterized protein n=1 Tax=Setomelanomma holmii TaxID=210430 RepID=A0A9P4HAJ0_9PLEO|nr:hypothetical protein EK21DRAFT_112358 [Setomelanomma holmii]